MPKDFENEKISGVGHNSWLDEHGNHVLIQAAKQMTYECLKFIPASFLWMIQTGHPKECCRLVSNLKMEIFKTSPELEVPDLYVFNCTCGDRHRRLLVETGKILSGMPAVARKGDVDVRH